MVYRIKSKTAEMPLSPHGCASTLCYELQGGRNGSAGSGEYAGHFRLREGKKALDDDRVELSSLAKNLAANRFFEGQSLAVRPRRKPWRRTRR